MMTTELKAGATGHELTEESLRVFAMYAKDAEIGRAHV